MSTGRSGRWAEFVRRQAGWRNPVVILSAVAGIAWAGSSVMAPLLPLFAESLHARPLGLGLAISAYAFAGMFGSLLAGALGSRWPIMLFLAGGLVVEGFSNLLIAGVGTLAGLVGLRALAGLGAGATLVGTRAYIARTTEPDRLAFVNGTVSAAESGGQALGPVLGGIVATLSNLRLPFVVVAITSALAASVSLRLPRQGQAGTNPQVNAAPAETVLPKSKLTLLLVAQFLVLAAYGGVFTIYPLFAVQQMGWSVLAVGLLVSAFGCGAILVGPRLARLADRTSRAAVGTCCLWAVALWLALTLGLAPRAVIFALGFAAGGAFAAYNGAWYALLTASVPPAMQTKVLAVVLAVSQLGVVAGATASSAAWQVWGIVVGLMVVVAAPLMASAAMAVLWRTGGKPAAGGPGKHAGEVTINLQVESS